MHGVFDRTQGSAAALSVGVHAAIAALLLWRGAVWFENSAWRDDRGHPALSWVVLPDAAAPTPHHSVATGAPASHQPVKRDLPAPIAATALPIWPTGPLHPSLRVPLPHVLLSPISMGDEVSDGSGKGASCGGDAEVVVSPEPPVLPTATAEAPQDDTREHFVQFWIRADGRVAKIAVSPPISDSRYRRRFMAALDTFVFGGVKTPDGRAIDYVYSCIVYS